MLWKATASPPAREAAFTPHQNRDLGRTRAQSWSYEPIDHEEDSIPRQADTSPAAASPAPDRGVYCPRCGTANARGVQLMVKDEVEKKLEGEKGKKAESKEEEPRMRKVEIPGKTIRREMDEAWEKAEEAKRMAKQQADASKNTKTTGEASSGEKIELPTNTGKDAEVLEDKTKVAILPARKLPVCDRCGTVDGENKKFWAFHVLDPAGL